jgi:hypothetical protein
LQRLGVEKRTGRPLALDGALGPKSRAAVYLDPRDLLNGEALGAWATGELLAGVQEVGGNNRGGRIAEYKRHSTRFATGAWCAEFVSAGLAAVYGEGAPYVRGARRLVLKLGKQRGTLTRDPAELYAGHIVAFERSSTRTNFAGHVGIVVFVTADHIYTIEGNVGKRGAVRVFRYDRDDPRMSPAEPFLYGARW